MNLHTWHTPVECLCIGWVLAFLTAHYWGIWWAAFITMPVLLVFGTILYLDVRRKPHP